MKRHHPVVVCIAYFIFYACLLGVAIVVPCCALAHFFMISSSAVLRALHKRARLRPQKRVCEVGSGLGHHGVQQMDYGAQWVAQGTPSTRRGFVVHGVGRYGR
jgi:hypothetical protein